MFQLLIFARVLSDKKVVSFHIITEKIHFSLRLKSRETNILGVLDTALLPSVPKFCCFRLPKYASSVRIGLREYRRLQNVFFRCARRGRYILKLSSSVLSVDSMLTPLKPFTSLTKSLLCNRTGILLWVSAVGVQGCEARALRFTPTHPSAQGFHPQERRAALAPQASGWDEDAETDGRPDRSAPNVSPSGGLPRPQELPVPAWPGSGRAVAVRGGGEEVPTSRFPPPSGAGEEGNSAEPAGRPPSSRHGPEHAVLALP